MYIYIYILVPPNLTPLGIQHSFFSSFWSRMPWRGVTKAKIYIRIYIYICINLTPLGIQHSFFFLDKVTDALEGRHESAVRVQDLRVAPVRASVIIGYLYMYMYMYTHTHTHTCMYVCVCVCVCVRACVCVCVCTYRIPKPLVYRQLGQ